MYLKLIFWWWILVVDFIDKLMKRKGKKE